MPNNAHSLPMGCRVTSSHLMQRMRPLVGLCSPMLATQPAAT